MTRAIHSGLAAAFLVTMTAAACGGGGSSTPTTPTSPTNPTTPTTPTSTATITIGSDGRVSPATVTITVGGRVTFVNNHNQAHDMSSDPHPEHTDCPPMAQVGFLSAGQSRTSGNFTTARTCGFHDHNQENNTALQGRIIIQ
jgi:plastocyanin